MSLLLALGLVGRLQAHPAGEAMAAAASAFLASLDEAQHRRATATFTAAEREDWHYVPKSRAGLSLKEMTAPQQDLALALVRTGLSNAGFQKAVSIRELEGILGELEGNAGSGYRDPEKYHLLIAGTPDPHGTWGWRFEGHHLSLNITIVGGELFAVTPSFLGANPAEVPRGPRRGWRVLAEEEDLGRALLLSLDAAQRKVAIISTRAPGEILTAAKRKVSPDAPEGIPAASLTVDQHAQLVRLIEAYVNRHRPDLAALDLRKIREAGLEQIHFAWAGGIERGQPHYYRVQGPTFLLEYDNTQNGANHIHTVWRDFEGDFGRDLLLEHLQADHRPDVR